MTWRLVGLLILALLIAPATASAAEPPSILLWPNGAPGSEGKTAPETVRLTPEDGEHIVSTINFPSITPYLPEPGQATGAAVIVIPGGGHRELWMDHEGYRVGRWLSAHGVAAFVLKYRLAREEGSTYTVSGDALADVRQALALVRGRAAEWGIAPDRVGVMGFSAGGELAVLALTSLMASRPDFAGLIYPAIPPGLEVTATTPPAFLVSGEDDSPEMSANVTGFYLAMRRAGASSAELHILANAGHGFGLRDRNPPALRAWPDLLLTWMNTKGMLARR